MKKTLEDARPENEKRKFGIVFLAPVFSHVDRLFSETQKRIARQCEISSICCRALFGGINQLVLSIHSFDQPFIFLKKNKEIINLRKRNTNAKKVYIIYGRFTPPALFLMGKFTRPDA